MKPLIKWPGGKTGEISRILHLIPEYDRYIEPFVGGGALYFYLNPERAVINDTSEYLMLFYRLLKEQNEEFHRIIALYDRCFGALKENCDRSYPKILDLYRLFEAADTAGIDAAGLGIHKVLTEEIACAPQVVSDLIADEAEYLKRMQDAVLDKMARTVKNTRKKPFSDRDLKKNLVTGFTGGFYLYFRSVFNDIAAGRLLCSDAYKAANFYFVREYCYGSMFRYNADGEFNIPYGGASYNKKDLTAKIRQMFQPDTLSLLSRTTLCCEDFEPMLEKLSLTERDFVFLDPPYDTEFSDYEGKDFAQEDHRRLAAWMERTSARFLLIIKDTAFVRSLYEGKFRMLPFDNQYSYNVRSRNQRQAQHLIITNIPEDEVPWIHEVVYEEI